MLTVMALVVLTGYAAAVELGATGRVGIRSWLLPAGLAVIFVSVHVVVRRFAPRADPVLLPCAVLINGIGVIFLHRLDLVGTQGTAATGSVLAGLGVRQLAWTAGAALVFALVLGFLRDHRVVSATPTRSP